MSLLTSLPQTSISETDGLILRRVLAGISSGRTRGYEQDYRKFIPFSLEIALERAFLSDYIKSSSPQVRKRLSQWLVIVALSLVGVFHCIHVHNLLQKDQREILQSLEPSERDLLRAVPDSQRDFEFHRISLYWKLFRACGGEHDASPRNKFCENYNAQENANIIGSLVGITGSNPLGAFDLEVMLNALRNSRVFTHEDIRRLDLESLMNRMCVSLPLGFPLGHWGIPIELLDILDIREVNQIRTYWSHFYSQQPSLKKRDNNFLVLLIWTSASDSVSAAVNNWGASENGLNLRRRLLRDLQASQTIAQLSLTIAAWLRLQQLLPNDTPHSFNGDLVNGFHNLSLQTLPSHPSNNPTHPINNSPLQDFDTLLKYGFLHNQNTIIEHMAYSLLLTLGIFSDGYLFIQQLLAELLDTDALHLEPFDETSSQYWQLRMNGSSHDDALWTYEAASSLCSWHSEISMTDALEINIRFDN